MMMTGNLELPPKLEEESEVENVPAFSCLHILLRMVHTDVAMHPEQILLITSGSIYRSPTTRDV